MEIIPKAKKSNNTVFILLIWVLFDVKVLYSDYVHSGRTDVSDTVFLFPVRRLTKASARLSLIDFQGATNELTSWVEDRQSFDTILDKSANIDKDIARTFLPQVHSGWAARANNSIIDPPAFSLI